MPINAPRKILLAPLDWGLGHTTRCIPIIEQLRKRGHSIVFAGNEWQRNYIGQTFPGIETLHLDGYNVSYSKTASGFMFSLFKQMPGLLRTVKAENKWLQRIAAEHKIDAVISDNRYGLFHKEIPSVIMTHQVQPLSGMGRMMDALTRKWHYKLLERFDNCWIVDKDGNENLSGALAHPDILPRNAQYIGWLSQLAAENITTKEDHLLILLSGPEPQRSMLSSLLWKQVANHKGKVVFVEGSDKVVPPIHIPSHIDYHQRLTKETLLPLIADASLVICRSGYSSLMDLVALGKKAILIPTPGQTEQEYLAKYLKEQGIFLTASQQNFRLENMLKDAVSFPFKKLPNENAFLQYWDVIDKWLLSESGFTEL